MADYDVSEALSKIEDMLISSMIRNLRHHLDLEKQEGISYTQWQAEQLAALADFRESTNTALGDYFKEFNERIGEALRKAYEAGGTEQETKILEALRNGWKRRPHSGQLSGSFFRINERRLNAYIASVKNDMERAEYALMRMADDQYRKAIFNAGVAYNTGAVTLPQAVDQATNDFLSRGLNCIEYRNGRRVNIDTYAEMAVRTSVTRSYLQGESAKRDEWGVNTVVVNKRGVACPKCLQYVGRVFYDDVYGHVKPQDGKYPLLSSAIAGGLYHPNCKDIHTTYFEGISTPPEPLTAVEEQKAAEVYDLEQRQRYHERQIRKYKRLSEWTNDPQERQKYSARLADWQKLNADFVEKHGDVLKRRREREVARDIRPRVPAPPELSENIREYSKTEGMLNAMRQSAEKDESAQFERYRETLGDMAPDSLDKFMDIRYNKPDEWNSMKADYRTVSRYTVDGDVPPEKILELDRAAWQTKQTGFDESKYRGRTRSTVNDMKRGGNAAVMELDGKTYFAHSKASVPGEPEFDSYRGEYELVGLRRDRKFKTLALGDGVPREHDTEAKFLEFVASVKKPTDTFEVTILSEKHICESCQGVVEQFRKMYPNAKVNIVSGKPGYNGDPSGRWTWKYRKRVK